MDNNTLVSNSTGKVALDFGLTSCHSLGKVKEFGILDLPKNFLIKPQSSLTQRCVAECLLL